MTNIALPKPVAAQSKFVSEAGWGQCTIEHATYVRATPKEFRGYEARYLYDASTICEVLDAATQLILEAKDEATRTTAAHQLQTIKSALQGCALVANVQDLPGVSAPESGNVPTTEGSSEGLAITSTAHRTTDDAPAVR